MRGVFLTVLCAFFPTAAGAFSYTQENVQTTYHEAPAAFDVSTAGEATGTTVSGMVFSQRNVANDAGVRLQRFSIGTAHWYVSDRGVIWAESDLIALSVYLSLVS